LPPNGKERRTQCKERKRKEGSRRPEIFRKEKGGKRNCFCPPDEGGGKRKKPRKVVLTPFRFGEKKIPPAQGSVVSGKKKRERIDG